tara:strand:- start:4483 stop:4788 length:306 start_codon:yes stop_codon:yes gene_type:complete
MATTLRQGFITGSGSVLDTVTSVSLSDTRIRSVFASGVGNFLITGTSTDARGTVKGNNIRFVNTTASDANELYFSDLGIPMKGVVRVSAPSSTATVAVFYG